MAGARGKSGRYKTTIYGRSYWISLSPQDADLLAFFEQLERLAPNQRNAALLAAIRGGAAAGQQAMELPDESRKLAASIDALLDAFE